MAEKLSSKYEKFCIEYAKSGNARQAYIKAGYKCKPTTADANASRLLKNAMVQKRLQELYEEAKNAKIADIREMQERLTSILRSETTEEVLVADLEQGTRTVEKKPSIKNIIDAITTLGKMQGAFVDRVDVTGSIPVVISGEDALDD